MHLMYLHGAPMNCLGEAYIKRLFMKRNIITSELSAVVTHYAPPLCLLYFPFYLRAFICLCNQSFLISTFKVVYIYAFFSFRKMSAASQI